MFPVATIIPVTLILATTHEPLPVGTTFLSVSLLTGFYLGRSHARENDLPDSFISRYWPLLIPMALLLARRIFTNASGLEQPSFYADELIIALALCYAPLIVTFMICVPPEKKLAGTKLRWLTCAIVVALFATLFATLAWQAKQDRDNTVRGYYRGVTITDDEAILGWYWPWNQHNRLAKLDTPASLILSGNFPTIDGATAFVPIFSAVANEIYQVDDKNELREYIRCSRTAEAYNRLIRGEVDMIFVLQPSDEHLTAAKDAGVELHLTPIAKEAFVFFVNRHNPVSDLSIEQIQNIYLRNITNWQQVGGNNKRILPFQRPVNSGSQTAMIKEVMRGKELPPPLLREAFGTMGALHREIAIYRDQEESIGYSFRFFTQVMVQYDGRLRRAEPRWQQPAPDAEPVKLLSVNGVAPTVENIRNGSYPFTQYVFVVTAGTSNPHVSELIDWLLSPQGQDLIEKTGYVGVRRALE